VVTFPEACEPASRSRTAPPLSPNFATDPTAGLAAIKPARSCSSWVEIIITGGGVGNPDRICSASAKPFSSPRSTSTSMTSGRRS
jgi:hypothetical protein